MLKKTKIFVWSVVSFVVIFSLGNHSTHASTVELVKNGDFEQGNVEWAYDTNFPTPILYSTSMNGNWYALPGLPQEFDFVAQAPINLPSDASSISFSAEIVLLDDTNFTGATAGIVVFDYNTREALMAVIYADQSGSATVTGDLTPYKGRPVDLLFFVDNETSGATAAADMLMAVDDVSIVATIPDVVAPATVPVYRLYSPARRSNHFTTSTAERDKLVAAGWTLEGIAYDVYASPTGHVPVYRLYSSARGANHFTTSVSERDKLIAAGWFLEGVAYYVSSSPTDHNPVYRLYSSAQSRNHFTQSIAERDKLTGVGWIYEGIAYYVPK